MSAPPSQSKSVYLTVTSMDEIIFPFMSGVNLTLPFNLGHTYGQILALPLVPIVH